MVLQVRWTDEAKFQFKEILNYWEARNDSSAYSEKLLNLINQSINRLLEYPEIGRKTDNEKIRLKIIKDYFLYYTFNDKHVFILGISDMRRNPKYLKKLLK